MFQILSVPSSFTAQLYNVSLWQDYSVKLLVASVRTVSYVIIASSLYDQVTKPPQRLRHIPQAKFLPYIHNLFQLRSYDETALEITLPAALKSKQGFYVVCIGGTMDTLLPMLIYPLGF